MEKKPSDESIKETIEYVKMRSGIEDESAIERLLKSINKHLYAIRSLLALIGVLIFLMLFK